MVINQELQERWDRMQVLMSKVIDAHPWVANIPISADPYLVAQSERQQRAKNKKAKGE